MDVKKLLADVTALPGVSGHEAQVSAYFAEQFRPLVDEVTVDAMYSVIAHKKGNGPKIMLCAHLDEIALMVTHIEDDGSLRLGNVGGVDPRILPASRVWVHGREKLFGTIGALPPHLMSAADRANNYTLDNLHVDIGMSAERAKELVRIGDLVTFDGLPANCSTVSSHRKRWMTAPAWRFCCARRKCCKSWSATRMCISSARRRRKSAGAAQ